MTNKAEGRGFGKYFYVDNKETHVSQNQIDYWIEYEDICVPVYKKKKSYKNVSQLTNYERHISFANDLEEFIKFYDFMINGLRHEDITFLENYLSFIEIDKRKVFKNSTYPDWYYYKNAIFASVKYFLIEQLEEKIRDTYSIDSMGYAVLGDYYYWK